MAGVNPLVVVHEPERGSCQAVMLTCIDYRFLRPACDLLEREGLLGTTDLIAWPGGATALLTEDAEGLLSALELALTVHGPPLVLLVAHTDCARLGGSGRFDGIEQETAHLEAALRDAAATVRRTSPDVRIRLFCLAGGKESEVRFPLMPVGEATCNDPTSSFPRTWEDAR